MGKHVLDAESRDVFRVHPRVPRAGALGRACGPYDPGPSAPAPPRPLPRTPRRAGTLGAAEGRGAGGESSAGAAGVGYGARAAAEGRRACA